MSAKDNIVSDVVGMMADTESIRNISVIAHVDHGKTTLTDSLVSRAGLLSDAKAGTACLTDTDEMEQQRGISISSTSVSLPVTVSVDSRRMRGGRREPPKPGAWSKEQAEKAAADRDELKSSSSSSTSSSSSSTSSSSSSVEQKRFLVNLIDSPGHIDFNSEVTAALRVTDGALVVVDCIEGVCVQTRTVLRQALTERIRPVLFLNKLDRVFFELGMEDEEIYRTLSRTVESVNALCASVRDDDMGDVAVYPQAGTVGFGSGLHGWGFTLAQFATLHHKRQNMSVRKLMKKLWGDNFYDPRKREWSTERVSADGTKRVRGFCYFVLRPLRKVFSLTLSTSDEDSSKYASLVVGSKKKTKKQQDASDSDALLDAYLGEMGVALSSAERALTGKALLKAVMRSWLPVADAMLDLIVHYLPSPLEAQPYRVGRLYDGPLDDEVAEAIRRCDPSGPLVMYCSKMVPNDRGSHFYAFGRVFSGSLRGGGSVRVQGPEYDPDDPEPTDVWPSKKVTAAHVMMGNFVAGTSAVPCGNLAGASGLDNVLVKGGTLVDTGLPDARNFFMMRHSVAPVVRVAVRAARPDQLNKLNQGLKRLAKCDPLVQVTVSPSGENVIAGAGELHVEVCLDKLQRIFAPNVELSVSEPVVPFRETVSASSDVPVMAKSSNKLNRFFMTAEPLGDEFVRAVHGTANDDDEQDGDEDKRDEAKTQQPRVKSMPLLEAFMRSGGSNAQKKKQKKQQQQQQQQQQDGEDGDSRATSAATTKPSVVVDDRLFATRLAEDFGWDVNDAKRVWSFGCPPDADANVLVDSTRAVQYLDKVKGSVMSAFVQGTAAGVYTEEPLHGVRFNLVDAKIHADSAHHGTGQVMPAVKRLVKAALLSAKPRLLEPVYRCDVLASSNAHAAGVFETLRQRRATVRDVTELAGDAVQISAYLPVAESFGFTELLRKNTSGQASPQMSFSHWDLVPGDIDDPTSRAHEIVQQIRARKGLPPTLPVLSDFNQKL